METQIESDLLRDTQPARLNSNEGRFPLPHPTLKMGLKAEPPAVFKLLLFRQPLGFFFSSPFHSLFLGQGRVERQAGGLARVCLLCPGCLRLELELTPAGAQEAQGLEECQA